MGEFSPLWLSEIFDQVNDFKDNFKNQDRNFKLVTLVTIFFLALRHEMMGL